MASMSYRELIALFRKNGIEFVRAAKGDHEIWWSPITKRHVTVDSNIKSRHTANEVLKQAGIGKKF